MTMPIVPSVLPKPVVMELTTAGAAMPPMMPVSAAAMMRARKAWILVSRIRKTRAAIPIPRPMSICAPETTAGVPAPTIGSHLRGRARTAASLIASTMDWALALPAPALSKAVPWSTEVRMMGRPRVTFTPATLLQTPVFPS